MSSLAGKDKRALRSKGQTLEACVTLGAAGLCENVLRRIEQEFTHSDLIKVRLSHETGKERKEMARRIAEESGSEVAGITGRSVLLYKKQ